MFNRNAYAIASPRSLLSFSGCEAEVHRVSLKLYRVRYWALAVAKRRHKECN